MISNGISSRSAPRTRPPERGARFRRCGRGHVRRDLRHRCERRISVDEQRFGIERGVGFDLVDVEDDDGDVVDAAGRVRRVDEQLGGALRIRLAARDAFDVALAHHVGEAVRAEDDAIAGDDVERVHVDLDVGVDTERAGDDRALRVRLGLFRGQAPFADELPDEAVVVGELAERAVVQEVRARVADVADEQAAAAGDDDRRHRRAHAGELRVAGRPFEDRVVGEGDRVVDRPAVRDRGAQRLDGGPRGDLARDMAAHPVGDREQRQPIVDDVRVLVVVADASRVRERAGGEFHARSARSTVWPTCSWSPLRTRAGFATCLPFRNVPFVEPRSSR